MYEQLRISDGPSITNIHRLRPQPRLAGISLHRPVPEGGNSLLGSGIIYDESRGQFRPPPTPYDGWLGSDNLNDSRLNSSVRYARMNAAANQLISEEVENERNFVYPPPLNSQQPAFYQPTVMAGSIPNSIGGTPLERSSEQQVAPPYNPLQPDSNSYQPPPSLMASALVEQQRESGYNSMGGVPMERSSGQHGVVPPYNPNPSVPHSRGGIISAIPETSYRYPFSFEANTTSSGYSHDYADCAPVSHQPGSANPGFRENATSSRYEHGPLPEERESATPVFGAHDWFGHVPQPVEPESNSPRMIANQLYSGREYGSSRIEAQQSTEEKPSKRRKRTSEGFSAGY